MLNLELLKQKQLTLSQCEFCGSFTHSKTTVEPRVPVRELNYDNVVGYIDLAFCPVCDSKIDAPKDWQEKVISYYMRNVNSTKIDIDTWVLMKVLLKSRCVGN